MSSKFRIKQSRKPFWQWLQENETEIFDLLGEDPEQAVQRIAKPFLQDYKNVFFELSPVMENGKIQFMVSADGDKRRFNLVQKIADTAPPFEKFDVVPFKQRKPVEFMMEMELRLGDIAIKADNVYFFSELEEQKLDLLLCIEGYDGSDPYKIGGFILLDGFLGEFDVEEYIGGVDFQALEKNMLFNLEPIWKLPQQVDALKRTQIHKR